MVALKKDKIKTWENMITGVCFAFGNLESFFKSNWRVAAGYTLLKEAAFTMIRLALVVIVGSPKNNNIKAATATKRPLMSNTFTH